MFDRVEYKTRAKDVLRGDYWSCFLVTLIFSLISGVGNGFLNIEVTLENMHTVYEQYAPVILAMLPYATVASIIGLLISLFVINVLHVGRARFFLNARRRKYYIGDLFGVYSSGHTMNCVKTKFMQDLFVFLWSLLFVIPGIIASYRYYFVDYILAEDPSMEWDEVLELSTDLTNGIKMDLFILDLSFIGWELLDLVTFNLAHYFVAPYKETTRAEAYAAYRDGNGFYRSETGYYEPNDRF